MRQRPKVRACLWFESNGEEAAEYQVSLFPDSFLESEVPAEDSEPAVVVEFTLSGVPYIILNGGPHYKHSTAAPISVRTEDQTETDRLWEALLADGGEESRCGWLVDRFGLFSQIIPDELSSLLENPVKEAASASIKPV